VAQRKVVIAWAEITHESNAHDPSANETSTVISLLTINYSDRREQKRLQGNQAELIALGIDGKHRW
jgi:hypothetical protein